MWAITPEERGKYDKQFDSLAPVLGYVSGTLLPQQTSRIRKKKFLVWQVTFSTNIRGFCWSLGEQARKFFLQSGLPPSVLAEIWLVIPQHDSVTRKRSYCPACFGLPV